jgi:hypothetical protein
VASRSRTPLTQTKFEKYIKEGRGSGSGKDYRPWIEVGDFSSRGRSHRILGWKSSRTHHLLSDHEKRVFLILEWADCIVDIREQFPLLDRELLERVADDMGTKCSTDSETQELDVPTTNFMLSVKRGDCIYEEVLTIKQSQDLNKKSVAKQLEIERRYFHEKKIGWKIITEKDYSRLMADNIELVHTAYHLADYEFLSNTTLFDICILLKARLKQPGLIVRDIVNKLDVELKLEQGQSLEIFKYLLATKQIIVDFSTTKVSVMLPTSSITNIT